MQLDDPLIPFQLKGTDLQMHGTGQLKNNQAVVIIFACNHCQYVRAYVTRLRDLFRRNQNRDVSFFLINSNDARQYPEDSFDHMVKMAEHLGIGGNYLHDESQDTARAYGAERTPEVFLFSKDRKLVYHGAIDDNWEKPEEVSVHYLEAALDAVFENEEVLVKQTQAKGCTIKWKK